MVTKKKYLEYLYFKISRIYIYIYIYIYVCMYVCMYMCVCIDTYTYAYTNDTFLK